MLVLSRKVGEEVVLVISPSSVERVVIVKPARIKPNTVGLGFEGPGDIKILRAELIESAVQFEEAPTDA